MNQELEDFRKKVVTEALKAAEDLDWCDEVYSILDKKLDLGDLLPPSYDILTRKTARHKKWAIYEGDYRDLEEAKEVAVEYRKSGARPRSNIFTPAPLYLDVRTMTPEAVQTCVNEAFAAWKAYDTKRAEVNPYPLFRVVNSKTGEVVFSEDEVNAVVTKA